METEPILARRGGAAESALPTCRVLLVEDEPELAETMQAALEEAGLRVSVLAHGERAYAAYIEERPDCVVLDLMLPGRSGFDVCQAIKRTKPAAPVIVLTGIDAGDSRELARRVGADGYFVKPIDPARLIAEIRSAVQRTNGAAASDTERSRSAVHASAVHASAVHGERILLRCRCGRRFRVSPIHRGQTLPCPTCGESLAVPQVPQPQ